MQNGVQGAQQGAQIGSAFGGYGAAYGAVIGGILGLMTPDYEKIAMDKYNQEVVNNNMRDIFDMRRIQNINNIEYSQALASYQSSAEVGKAAYNAQFGAADMIGSSADALQQTLDFQTTQAMAQTQMNWETSLDNLNTQMRRSSNAASNSLRRKRGDQTKMDYGGMIDQGMALYGQYKGGGASMGTTTTASSTGGGLSGLSDFGSFGSSGSATGASSAGSMFG